MYKLQEKKKSQFIQSDNKSKSNYITKKCRPLTSQLHTCIVHSACIRILSHGLKAAKPSNKTYNNSEEYNKLRFKHNLHTPRSLNFKEKPKLMNINKRG
jgi:hypothetical protein